MRTSMKISFLFNATVNKVRFGIGIRRYSKTFFCLLQTYAQPLRLEGHFEEDLFKNRSNGFLIKTGREKTRSLNLR